VFVLLKDDIRSIFVDTNINEDFVQETTDLHSVKWKPSIARLTSETKEMRSDANSLENSNNPKQIW